MIIRTYLLSQQQIVPIRWQLTHWGRATHICVGKLTIIGSDNGLCPGRRQAIIWINCLQWYLTLLKCILGNKLKWNFNRKSHIFIQENAIERHVVCEVASILFRPQCVHDLPTARHALPQVKVMVSVTPRKKTLITSRLQIQITFSTHFIHAWARST